MSDAKKGRAKAALAELAAETEGEQLIQFAVAKRLPYGLRALLVLGLALGGVWAQAATLNPWVGLPLVIAALVLAWVSGLDNAADRRALKHAKGWEAAPIDRLEEIAAVSDRMARWDRSPVEISNCLGAFTFILLAGGIAAVTIYALSERAETAALAIALDGGVLLLFQWFAGTRSYVGQPNLLVKVKHLQATLKQARAALERLGTLQTQLKMSGQGDKPIPVDVRLTVSVPDAPPEFLGLQIQVVLNHVQGTPYPYLYAVVVAKENEGLLPVFGRIQPPKGVIHERKTQEDVDVAIIRQHTTRTSGYHTKPAKSAKIIANAVEVAQAFLDSRAATAG